MIPLVEVRMGPRCCFPKTTSLSYLLELALSSSGRGSLSSAWPLVQALPEVLVLMVAPMVLPMSLLA